MRLISFGMTIEAIEDRSKTVTRRIGWAGLQPGTLLQGVEKAMGLKKGESVKRLAVVRVLNVRREPINAIDQPDVDREGLPHLTPDEFVARFCKAMRCQPGDECTRIEFEYVDDCAQAALEGK